MFDPQTDRITPYQLETHLNKLLHSDLMLWQRIRNQTYKERSTAQAQHRLYYANRDKWELGVKTVIASISVIVLAVGAPIPMVLGISSILLVVNCLAMSKLARVHHPEIDLSLLADPVENIELSKSDWGSQYLEHDLKRQAKEHRHRAAKAAFATTFGFFMMIGLGSTAFSPVSLVLVLGFIGTLVIDAQKEPDLFLERSVDIRGIA